MNDKKERVVKETWMKDAGERLRLAQIRRMGCAAVLSVGCSLSYGQSSVTLYGVVDTGIEYISNVGRSGGGVYRMPTLTGSYPSRWGLTGTEDIGGGNKVIFRLESGFATAQGTLNQGGREFGRQAFVGISTNLGTVSMGRQYSMIFWSLANADIMGPNSYAGGVLDGYLSNARLDNSIAYRGRFGGFDVGATFSFGHDAVAAPAGANCGGRAPADANACRDYSAMVKYDGNGWGVSAAFERIYGGPAATGGLTNSGLHDSRAVLGAYVNVGAAKVGGYYVRRINDGDSRDHRSNLYIAGVSFPVAVVWVFDLQAGRLNFEGSPDTSEVIAARVTYLLSKRSSVFLTGGRVWNHGNATVPVSGSAATGTAPAPGQDQTGVMIGMRHNF